MAKICTRCGKEWPDQFRFCPECSGDVVEKKDTEAGSDFRITLRGSAVNGGINKTDSHNISHNVDSHEVHSTTNNTTQNVTNYIQQVPINPEESLRERLYEFRQYCERIIQSGGILSPEGEMLLDEKMFALGLNRDDGESVVVSVKKRKMRSSSGMNALARLKLDAAKIAVKANSPNLSRLLSELKGYILIYDNEELHFYYYLLLSALDPVTCVTRYEERRADSYWMAFWAYMAYIKLGNWDAAELLLATLSTFIDMPESNLILLDAAGHIRESIVNREAEENRLLLLESVTDDCSDLLEDFRASLIAIYSNKMERLDFFATYFYGSQELMVLKMDSISGDNKGNQIAAHNPDNPKEIANEEIKDIKQAEEMNAEVLPLDSNQTIVKDEPKSNGRPKSPARQKVQTESKASTEEKVQSQKKPLYLKWLTKNGEGLRNDIPEKECRIIVEALKADAEKGSILAQKLYGDCFFSGQVVAQNYSRAVKWYQKAADQGSAAGKNALGTCYLEGLGIEQNKKNAAKLFRDAANQGFIIAHYNLGLCYYYGTGVRRHYAEAVSWFLVSAEKGYPPAQYLLGLCYFNGKGVTVNVAEALKWWRQAAENEFTRAQATLGWFYSEGFPINQRDNGEAAKWYKKAADKGDAGSQFALGLMYEEGTGVPKDGKRALALIQSAAKAGDEQAIRYLEKPTAKITKISLWDDYRYCGRPAVKICVDFSADKVKDREINCSIQFFHVFDAIKELSPIDAHGESSAISVNGILIVGDSFLSKESSVSYRDISFEVPYDLLCNHNSKGSWPILARITIWDLSGKKHKEIVSMDKQFSVDCSKRILGNWTYVLHK